MLSTLKPLDCNICTRDINEYYNISKKIIELNYNLYKKISDTSYSLKALSPGRIVVINNLEYRNIAAVILKPSPHSILTDVNKRLFYVFMLLGEDKNTSKQESLPPLPATKLFISSPYIHKIESIPYGNISVITKSSIKLNVDIIEKDDKYEISKVTQELLRYIDGTQNA